MEEELEKNDNLDNNDAINTAKELKTLYYHKDNMIWQKARTNWDAFGDKNTRYFHQVVCRRRQRNNINGMLEGQTWVTNPQLIKKGLSATFQCLLQ